MSPRARQAKARRRAEARDHQTSDKHVESHVNVRSDRGSIPLTSTTKSTCKASAFLFWARGLSPLADASCSAAASPSAHLSLLHGTATKVPHRFRFTSHPRCSVAPLLTTPAGCTIADARRHLQHPASFCGVFAYVPASALRGTKMRTFAPLLVYAPAENHGFSPGDPDIAPRKKS